MKRFAMIALIFSIVLATATDAAAQRSCNNANPRGRQMARVRKHQSNHIKLKLRKQRQQQRAAKSTEGYLQ